VLIVEPDVGCRASLAGLLSNAGASVQACSTAGEALRALEWTVPDVLLSDVMLPDIDGFELIRTLRSRESNDVPRVPAIALTTAATVGDRIKALAAGFTTHLLKPVDADDFIVAVAKMAGLTAAAPAAAIDPTPIALRDYAPTIYELPFPDRSVLSPDRSVLSSLRRPLVTIRDWLTAVDTDLGETLTVEARAQLAEASAALRSLIELLARGVGVATSVPPSNALR
jgi:CheY-like chemotaxis protein